MKPLKHVIDHSDPQQRARFLARAGQLRGLHEWTWRPYRPKRSNRANSFVWAAQVASFQAFNAQQGVHFTDQEAFDILKRECLPPGKTFTSRRTGEVITLPARSSNLNSEEFSDFIELVNAYLADIGAEVPDSPTTSPPGTGGARAMPATRL